jgi:uncharacterized repeat protein (TIGR02543 family)
MAIFVTASCDSGNTPEPVAKPSAAPAGGNYTTAQTVTLATATTGADIHYTTNGAAPSASSAKYSSPITISATTTLKAVALKEGMTNSSVLTEVYTITTSNQVAKPTATPNGGYYATAQTVTLETGTPDAAIFYTLNGATPTTGSSYYIDAITISATATLKAVAIKSGMTDSAVLTEAYTIALPTVTFDADGGTPAPESPVTKNPGDTISQPPAMTKNWHAFDGWYSDLDRTIPAVFPITVNADVNLYAKWTVNTLTSVADVNSYLTLLPANTSDNPSSLPLNFNLGTMTAAGSGWRQLLDAINTSGKYVNLDLSACTMSGNSFNPDSSIVTGKDKIVSLALPTAAMSIEAGTYYFDSTFKNFSNLKSISGVNIFSIGDYAFDSFGSYYTTGTNLQRADFPQATSIGERAFYFCTSLQRADFPQAASIGERAFCYCTSLQSASFPASVTLSSDPAFGGCTSLTSFTLTGSGALSVMESGRALVRNGTELVEYPSASGTVTMSTITTIGSVFSDCTGLQSVSFPQVTSIGEIAFYGCLRLKTADFPEVTNIEDRAFTYCESLQSLNIPKVTSIGAVAFARNTGDTDLVITMGSTAPTLDRDIFYNTSYNTSVKTVTIKVPNSFASGYTPFSGYTVTVSGYDTIANWANGLRGGGWTGTTWASGGGTTSIDQNITVIIQVQ